MPEMTRRRLLASAGTAAAAALRGRIPATQRAPGAGSRASPAKRQPERHQARRDPHAGEPVIRSLLRHTARRAWLLPTPPRITLSTGRSVFYQPDPDNPDGYLLPFHLDTQTTSAQAIPSTSHAWTVQHSAWDSGKMDNWLPAHLAADGKNGPFTMGLLRARGHPVPVRAGRVVHDLRQLSLLGAGPDLAEPAVPHQRHHRPARRARPADHQQQVPPRQRRRVAAKSTVSRGHGDTTYGRWPAAPSPRWAATRSWPTASRPTPGRRRRHPQRRHHLRRAAKHREATAPSPSPSAGCRGLARRQHRVRDRDRRRHRPRRLRCCRGDQHGHRRGDRRHQGRGRAASGGVLARRQVRLRDDRARDRRSQHRDELGGPPHSRCRQPAGHRDQPGRQHASTSRARPPARWQSSMRRTAGPSGRSGSGPSRTESRCRRTGRRPMSPT